MVGTPVRSWEEHFGTVDTYVLFTCSPNEINVITELMSILQRVLTKYLVWEPLIYQYILDRSTDVDSGICK
jgi:hypothetical protein